MWGCNIKGVKNSLKREQLLYSMLCWHIYAAADEAVFVRVLFQELLAKNMLDHRKTIISIMREQKRTILLCKLGVTSL